MESPAKRSKRQEYLDWDEYYMAIAFLAAKRSKDPITQVGACIVDKDHIIVGLGYNGMPTGCSDDEFPWGKDTINKLNSKFTYVVHAEVNAILNKNMMSLKDCKMYVALFPCNECAKIIIQAKIKEVVYLSDKNAHKAQVIASKKMFEAAGVKFWQYEPKNKQITIDFTEIEWKSIDQSPLTPMKNL